MLGKKERLDIFFALLGTFLITYILLPIAMLYTKQLCDLDALIRAFHDPLVREALKNSILTATITMLLSLAFGVPLGYTMARREFKGKNIIQTIIDLPIVIPHSVVGIMLLITFSEAILDNYLGIIAAMTFVSAPFTVNASRDAFALIDERLEHVARTLGATKFKAFLTITLPLALPSILTGAIMTWARAISEVGAILIVAYYPKTAQVLVLEYFQNYGLQASRPIAVILLTLSLVIFIGLRYILSKMREFSYSSGN